MNFDQAAAQQCFDELCEPLFKSNTIYYFRYTRYHLNHQLFSLNSNPQHDLAFMQDAERCLRLIDSTNEYWECYDFAADVSLQMLYNRDPWLFRRFVVYFWERARELFSRGVWCLMKKSPTEIKQLHLPELPDPLPEEFRQQFLSDTSCRRYYLSGNYQDVYLTPKELNIMYWAARGKNTHEVSVIMRCSIRTVEKHISAVKWKLSAARLTHAIRILVE